MRHCTFFLLLPLLLSCGGGRTADIASEFAWLEGTWKLLDAEMAVYEAWHLEGEEWQGESYAAVDGMKVPTEKIRLYREGDRIVFSQRVKDRDNGEPVDFLLTEKKRNQYTFANPDYPFPSSITYTRVSDVAMKVRISGQRNGAWTEVFLEYVRKP
jgi:hypothetical protein